MGKTRDLFKKIRDTKGTFHAKMGSIKDRSGMDLTEAEDIKKSWQEYTEELCKKDLHDPGNHDGVITHLEPDILECEVKWALQGITMNKVFLLEACKGERGVVGGRSEGQKTGWEAKCVSGYVSCFCPLVFLPFSPEVLIPRMTVAVGEGKGNRNKPL